MDATRPSDIVGITQKAAAHDVVVLFDTSASQNGEFRFTSHDHRATHEPHSSPVPLAATAWDARLTSPTYRIPLIGPPAGHCVVLDTVGATLACDQQTWEVHTARGSDRL
jgi:hypothetical protein